MRVGVIEEIYTLMKKRSDIYFLTGDLGYSAVEKIEEDFGERFINVGVAEQNMIGIAAGLAMTGKKVYVYSIIPFLILRALEQIRDDLCYQDLPVTLVGIGSGLSYGYLSSTHFALEDIAIMRAIPNMTILSPADEAQARASVRAMSLYNHPTYIRIGKRREPVVYAKKPIFVCGEPDVLTSGKDCLIITTGSITAEVAEAGKFLLNKQHIASTIVTIPTIKPLNTTPLIKLIKKTRRIVVVEEHGSVGGLGSIIADLLFEKKIELPLLRIDTGTEFIKTLGSQSYLRKKLELDSIGIAKQISRFCRHV